MIHFFKLGEPTLFDGRHLCSFASEIVLSSVEEDGGKYRCACGALWASAKPTREMGEDDG